LTKPTNRLHNAAAHKICEERTPAFATTAMVSLPIMQQQSLPVLPVSTR
jgi:hypothetical protein